MQTNPTTNRRRASSPASLIRPGDKVRLYDQLHGQYFWHRVDDVINGSRTQIKVDGYDWYINASLVSGHQKGARRNG